jgi:hypothetical protein
MSTKARAMHLLVIWILPRFESSFLPEVSTFLKNGNKTISGRKGQPTTSYGRNKTV